MSCLEEKKTLTDEISSSEKKETKDEINSDTKVTIAEKKHSNIKTPSEEASHSDIKTMNETSAPEKQNSAKKRFQRSLKFLGIIITTVLIPVILSAYQDTTSKWIKNLFGGTNTNSVSATPNQKKLQSDEAILIKLNQLSYNGRIPNCEFPLGTSEETLLQKWGEPDYKSDVGMVEYWEYKNYHMIIGIHKNRIIDIRSFDPVLQKITLGQLKEAGKPDKEYDHMSLNQHFIIYHMGKYKLRMIFPKPTAEAPSPNLINVSLVDINYAS
jgi:hypothetical protein